MARLAQSSPSLRRAHHGQNQSPVQTTRSSCATAISPETVLASSGRDSGSTRIPPKRASRPLSEGRGYGDLPKSSFGNALYPAQDPVHGGQGPRDQGRRRRPLSDAAGRAANAENHSLKRKRPLSSKAGQGPLFRRASRPLKTLTSGEPPPSSEPRTSGPAESIPPVR